MRIYNSAPLTSICIYFTIAHRDSGRVISFSRRETLTLIENVVTHFPIYVAVIILRWIYDWLPTARVHARKILSSSICLCKSVTVPSRPVLVWQQLFVRLTSALKYMLDQYCRFNRGNYHALARDVNAHSRTSNIAGSKFGISYRREWSFISVILRQRFLWILNSAKFCDVKISYYRTCYTLQNYI